MGLCDIQDRARVARGSVHSGSVIRGGVHRLSVPILVLTAFLCHAATGADQQEFSSGNISPPTLLLQTQGDTVTTCCMSPQNITIFPLVNLVFYLTARSDELEQQYQTLWNAVDDKIGLEAIRSLHQQLDDDQDGSIEPSETGDFIKVDLQVSFKYY